MLITSLLLFAMGVWAVLHTQWTPAAAAADQPVAAVTTPTATASVAAPGSPQPSAASATPAVWTQSKLRDHLVAELNASDPAQALADLARITDSQPYVSRICHPVAHDLGHAALQKYGDDFAKAASFRNDVCGSGYLHGIVEEKLSQSPDPASAVTKLCAPDESASCIHGIGHGAMFVSRLKLPDAEQLCRKFSQTYQVVACSEGVFMQLFEPDETDPAATAQLPADKLAADPLYPCPEQPDVFQGACYFYAPVYFLQKHDYADHPESFAEALRWCLAAPTSDGRQACTRGTGSRLMKYNIDRPAWVGDQCEAALEAWQRPLCVSGMTSYWNVNYHDKSAKARLCPQLSPAARNDCRSAAAGSGSAD
ncbi:hypothetical protein ACFVSN_44960 [Kitasatospora sp. NPDC057904]|uniref:hypothetical protein n=1 Tax=Kitasatospora sp. NPDC057904 TaxID=3346275 RepID=UPI0036D8678C